MKIEEVKKAIRELDAFNYCDFKGNLVRKIDVLSILDQLDKPKPEVPQFVVNWVNNTRELGYDFEGWFDCNNQPIEVFNWLNLKNKRCADENGLALATLIVNGYDAVEVKKEKLYIVEIPNPNNKQISFRLKKWIEGKVIIAIDHSTNDFTDEMCLTESEIRKDFDWAWQFREEVE